MKTADIIILVDPQNGFARDDLSHEQGGCLYVPGGEAIMGPAAGLIRQASDSIVILSQDFHPSDHISFASNHGAAPMSEIPLKRGENGLYQVAAGEEQGAFRQTLWTDHCVQGTESALFADPLMDELPAGLAELLRHSVSLPVLTETDDRGNTFYVIRKGARTDLDSYGIATENDGISTTSAPFVFNRIANGLKASGIRGARISLGGLATNFCVEFSHNDIYQYLIPMLNIRGIEAGVGIMTDACRGIPVAVPGGAWPDLTSAADRMAAMGTQRTTTEEVICHIKD